MTLLSVNINKVALLRNSRMNGIPSLIRAAQAVIDAGAEGITVHPRKDARHVTLDDVLALAALPAIANREVEFNIEGDVRGELVRVVRAVRPTQFTAVPTTEGEITSSRGWRVYDDLASLQEVRALLPEETRFSVFIDPEPGAVAVATTAGAGAIEIYTGLYAVGFKHRAKEECARLNATALHARGLGLRVNAGHDLDLENLPLALEAMRPDELSIGHALIADALTFGMAAAVEKYLHTIAQGSK